VWKRGILLQIIPLMLRRWEPCIAGHVRADALLQFAVEDLFHDRLAPGICDRFAECDQRSAQGARLSRVGAAAPLQEAAVTALELPDAYYHELQTLYAGKRCEAARNSGGCWRTAPQPVGESWNCQLEGSVMTSRFCPIICGTVLFCASTVSAQQYKYPFQDPNLPIEVRVNNILSLMTVEEKIAALSTDPSVPRLGISGSSHIEGLHGVALGGPGGWGGRGLQTLPTTQFPQSVGLGETWDPELIRQAAALEGYEARYTFNTDTQFATNYRGERHRRVGIVVRAPNADLARDPRWGRSEESFGEDPYLTGTMAACKETTRSTGSPPR
jgi:hypothetical protein